MSPGPLSFNVLSEDLKACASLSKVPFACRSFSLVTGLSAFIPLSAGYEACLISFHMHPGVLHFSDE